MTNYDRALRVLEAARRPGEMRIHPNDAVEALAQAGLLAEDLPAPDRDMRDQWWKAEYEAAWDSPHAPSIWDTTTLYEVGAFPGDPDITIWYDGEPLEPFSIDEVRALRLALHAAEQTAAAQHTKEEA
ncbi:hypothetical protein [Corynebacterium aurimucosum]